MVASEDAFDAAISALVMERHTAQLARLAADFRSRHPAGGRRLAPPPNIEP